MGRSLIATDTLESDVIARITAKRGKETRTKKNNNICNVFQDDSEKNCETELEDDSDEENEDFEENDDTMLIEKCLQKSLPRPPEMWLLL